MRTNNGSEKKHTPDREESREFLYEVARLFFATHSPAEVARRINQDTRFNPNPALTRESVYPLFYRALELGIVTLNPPIEESLSLKIAKQYDCKPGSIRVVNTLSNTTDAVPLAAARWALEIIETLARETTHPADNTGDGKLIGIGLGPGRSTLDFCRHFSTLVQQASLSLRIVAITAGGPATAPEEAPTGFFNLFPSWIAKERVGLFAENLVPARDIGAIRSRSGVKEAFGLKDKIDVIVTAMGDFEDEHDNLKGYLSEAGANTEDLVRYCGNVQYRPYDASGNPILEKGKQLRPVTLFELDELADMAANRWKRVLLISRSCAQCQNRTRARALRPLLERKEKCFSNLVIDIDTARELSA